MTNTFPARGDRTTGDAALAPRPGQPSAPDAESLIGRTLSGKYRLVRCIGQGGMGTIFDALHLVIGSHVAVKLLHPIFANRREPVERLHREARASAAIGHPNIIQTFDVGQTEDGVPYLVMELLAGESLGQRLDRDGPQTLGFVLALADQLLSALEAAHKAGIIHRDLKSDNIFVLAPRDDDPTARFKILDFGISKFIEADADNLRLTQTGTVLGTPYYMSPEQAAGQKNLDRRIDIYAAGVILYEALLGNLPHHASNYNALLVEILTRDVPPFRKRRKDVPESLERAVLRALARDREQRFATARELLEAVQTARRDIPDRLLAVRPVVGDAPAGARDAPPHEPFELTATTLELARTAGLRRRRSRLAFAASAVALLAAALAILALLPEPRPAAPIREPVPAPRPLVPPTRAMAPAPTVDHEANPRQEPASARPDDAPPGPTAPAPAAKKPARVKARRTAPAPASQYAPAAREPTPAPLDRPMDNPF